MQHNTLLLQLRDYILYLSVPISTFLEKSSPGLNSIDVIFEPKPGVSRQIFKDDFF